MPITKKNNSNEPGALKRTVAESDFLLWAYMRFFIVGDEKIFRECYSYYFATRITWLGWRKKFVGKAAKENLEIEQQQLIKKKDQLQHIAALTKDGDLCCISGSAIDLLSLCRIMLSSGASNLDLTSSTENLKQKLLTELADMQKSLGPNHRNLSLQLKELIEFLATIAAGKSIVADEADEVQKLLLSKKFKTAQELAEELQQAAKEAEDRYDSDMKKSGDILKGLIDADQYAEEEDDVAAGAFVEALDDEHEESTNQFLESMKAFWQAEEIAKVAKTALSKVEPLGALEALLEAANIDTSAEGEYVFSTLSANFFMPLKLKLETEKSIYLAHVAAKIVAGSGAEGVAEIAEKVHARILTEKIKIIRDIVEKNKSNPLIGVKLKTFIKALENIPLLELGFQLQYAVKDGDLTKDKKQKLNEKLIKIERDIKPKKIEMSNFFYLGLIYNIIFSVIFAKSLGVSIMLSIILGLTPALAAAFIAITIPRVKNNIDSNKLFNVFLFGLIFAVFAVIAATKVTMAYSLIFSLLATIITYNVLNIMEIIIKNLLPGIVFAALSFIKDLVRELALVLLCSIVFPLSDFISKLYKSQNEITMAELRFIKNFALGLILFGCGIAYAVTLSNMACAWLVPIIGSSIIYNVVFFIIFCCVFYFSYNRQGKPVKDNFPSWLPSWYVELSSKPWAFELPRWHTKLIDTTAISFNSAYDSIEKRVDKSSVITNYASRVFGHVFDAYCNIMPVKISDQESGLVLCILQAVIDAILFPIFAICYPVCKIVGIVFQNAKRVLSSHPEIAALFFVATAVLCATFASPIQLYLFGSVLMAGSPVMSIAFGVMVSSANMLFSANLYFVTSHYVAPRLADAFASSCKALGGFYGSMSSNKDKTPKVAPGA